MRRRPTTRFLFRLALRLGWLDPHAMARRMSAKLLQEWETYAAIEPFDELRADLRTAQITQMLYNVNRDNKKEPKGRPIEDFMFNFDAEELTDEQKQKQMDNKFKVMEIMFRAQAEAAKESQMQAPPNVIEFSYPQPEGQVEQQPVEVVVDDAVAAALAKARAAMKDV